MEVEKFVELVRKTSDAYVKSSACCITKGEKEAFSIGFMSGLDERGLVDKKWLYSSRGKRTERKSSSVLVNTWVRKKVVLTYGEKVAYIEGYTLGAEKKMTCRG